jgi:hypothetical protein
MATSNVNKVSTHICSNEQHNFNSNNITLQNLCKFINKKSILFAVVQIFIFKIKIMTFLLNPETLKLKKYISPGGKFGGRLVATRKTYSTNRSTTASTRNGFMITVLSWRHTSTEIRVSRTGHCTDPRNRLYFDMVKGHAISVHPLQEGG